jgi:hypothetical protein
VKSVQAPIMSNKRQLSFIKFLAVWCDLEIVKIVVKASIVGLITFGFLALLRFVFGWLGIMLSVWPSSPLDCEIFEKIHIIFTIVVLMVSALLDLVEYVLRRLKNIWKALKN